MRAGWAAAGILALICVGSAGAGAQAAPPSTPASAKPADAAAEQKARLAEALKNYHGPDYVLSEAMIPVRDGVLLHTVIVRPVGSEAGSY